MNVLDRVIAYLSPQAAARRLAARESIRAYTAAENNLRLRRADRENRSGAALSHAAQKPLREKARYLDQNYDLVTGLLNTFCDNVVGRGITVEPQPRTPDGAIQRDFQAEIIALYREWANYPEVTWEYNKGHMEWLAALHWARDGEVFCQHVLGKVRKLKYNTRIPYAIELLESDMIPFDLSDPNQGQSQGIRFDAWGRPVAYTVSKYNPGDLLVHTRRMAENMYKEIPAERMSHLKMTRRFNQPRGISLLAPVITRFQDLADYEESERVAARVAAAMAAYIRKGIGDDYTPMGDESGDTPRQFNMSPGMVFDDLRPGEDIGVIESKRPSQLLQPFRDSMLKAAASATGVSYSTLARDYSGTYSSQRQQLVESFVSYGVNTSHMVGRWVMPQYHRFLTACLSAGLLRIPADVDPATVEDAVYFGPTMPWIDPQKEAQANVTLIQAGLKSQSQVLRERNQYPDHVMAELQREREDAENRGLVLSSDFKHQVQKEVENHLNDEDDNQMDETDEETLERLAG